MDRKVCPSVTVLHNMASLIMPNSDPRGKHCTCISVPNNHVRFLYSICFVTKMPEKNA